METPGLHHGPGVFCGLRFPAYAKKHSILAQNNSTHAPLYLYFCNLILINIKKKRGKCK